uniref:17-beta-hydroxysteroid dehydrogenase type 3 n=1 Tax=Monopterus albus TaxID=43700 RepID=UPI0009B3D611|nr:testosterone 17-beta-dehydrogenase 3 [Monopterus albus]
MNVVILSRTKASLDRVAKEIGKNLFCLLLKFGLGLQKCLSPVSINNVQYIGDFTCSFFTGNATGQKVKVIVADFTKDNVFSEIEDQLKDLSVGVLVNNVGIIPSIFPSKLLECADLEQTITHVINCNVKTVVKMCKIILPGMENRGKGVILNISSGFASVPVPYYILYSASKAFIERFSQGLQAEYRDKGIIIQVVAPFGVSTRMTFYQKASVTVLTSEDFVKSSLQYLRAGDKTNGSVCHIIMAWLLRFIPFEVIYTERVLQGINNYIMKRVEEPISASNATLENGRTNQG